MATYTPSKVPSNCDRITYVTYDLARKMPGATEVSTSALGDQIIKRMTD
jgi:isocitrate dehydrogenase